MSPIQGTVKAVIALTIACMVLPSGAQSSCTYNGQHIPEWNILDGRVTDYSGTPFAQLIDRCTICRCIAGEIKCMRTCPEENQEEDIPWYAEAGWSI